MAICRDRYTGYTYTCQSSWYDWGRWVVLGIIILSAFLFFFFCACVSQRRRRKLGRQPYYGTGWTQRLPYGHAPPQYNPGYGQQQGYQQQYQSPNYNTGGYYGENQGYYGGQQTEVEMQRPQNAYASAPGQNVYQPPPGPPPGKH